MTLDVHSKHGILIGYLHLIAYIIFAIGPALRAIRYANNEEYDDIPEMAYECILQSLGYLFMATLSGLLVFGVIKKRHLFMAPWIVCTGVIITVLTGILVIQCFTEFNHILMVLEYNYYVIGMQILIIYPTYNLYKSIREESKKTLYSKNIEYSNNINKNSFENPINKTNNDILSEKLQV